ncbi:hypothetical protein [Thermotalea metallivorans]|uniref:Uncharacterized protein n=1 Tax=Thermotalea metallivorans TaxID=520762 RepID=A0A140L0K8_9FIRM|nr:hypothetical protein [Thermotalea metallivorans]KXG74083.1 hypothetical protein AN619_25980 [Thermotalea metallivorans]
MDKRKLYAGYVNNTDVNGYISNLIHEDKKIIGEQPKKDQNSPHQKKMFYSEHINDSVANLDITV